MLDRLEPAPPNDAAAGANESPVNRELAASRVRLGEHARFRRYETVTIDVKIHQSQRPRRHACADHQFARRIENARNDRVMIASGAERTESANKQKGAAC